MTSAPSQADFVSYEGTVLRMVEAQHRISTSRLTDSLADEERLEMLIEQAKPSLPEQARGLHYLLATPFRYGHRSPSRFRKAGERPGIFYASESPKTCIAEMAYWRLRFFAAAPDAMLPATTTEYLMFGVGLAVERAIDLMRPPFVERRSRWADKQSWIACQDFAVRARRIGTQMIRYESTRDAEAANVALFDPACFTTPVPTSVGTWHFRFHGQRLVVIGAAPSSDRYQFEFAQFGLTRT